MSKEESMIKREAELPEQEQIPNVAPAIPDGDETLEDNGIIKFCRYGNGYLSFSSSTPFILDEKQWDSVEECFQNGARENWTDADKFERMYRALVAKYTQHHNLAVRLLETEHANLVAKDDKEPVCYIVGTPYYSGEFLQDVRHELRTTGGAHPFLESRLQSTFEVLNALYKVGEPFTTTTRGSEREIFVTGFLAQMFPPAYRFSSGDIIDTQRIRSGQVDIVVEFQLLYSLSLMGGAPRLHLAENVALAIEVKSNLRTQWGQVAKSASKIKALQRRYRSRWDRDLTDLLITQREIAGGNVEAEREKLNAIVKKMKAEPPERIPVLAVGFKGWGNIEEAQKALNSWPEIDALFVITEKLFLTRKSPYSEPMMQSGDWSLLTCLDYISFYARQTADVIPPAFNYHATRELGA